MRVVLDTNVMVSGLLSPARAPGRLLVLWGERRFDLFISQEQYAEVRRVLNEPYIRRELRKELIGAFLNRLRRRAKWVRPAPVPPVLEDEDDLVILGTAVAAKADLLVSGDKKSGFIKLERFQGVRMATPSEALRLLEGYSGR